MSDHKSKKVVKRVKTGAIERRFSMAKAGVFAGAKFATQTAATVFSNKEDRERKQKEILSNQAQYLADELGKLKGSIVKVGQMLALWGEHFLPKEVTDALHTLEDDTAIVQWPVMRAELEKYLGRDKLMDLDIDPDPIGAASLGQVYLATRKTDGKQICLKIQYPGVATAIDSDLDAVAQLLKVTRVVPFTQEFEEWLEEIRAMMNREVDYELELRTTARFKKFLEKDSRFIVPEVYPEYSSSNVIATEYQPGHVLNSDVVLNLSQERRNAIGEACLDLCWQEVFNWGEMQTDPNFGNYFVRLGENGDSDKIILLDFGAVRKFTPETLVPGKKLILGSYLHDKSMLRQAMLELRFMTDDFPDDVFETFTELCFLAMEPFSDLEKFPPPAEYLNEDGAYIWEKSNLASRALVKASKSAASKHFAVPPKELMFLSRKLIGAFTLMSVISAEIKGQPLLAKYVD